MKWKNSIKNIIMVIIFIYLVDTIGIFRSMGLYAIGFSIFFIYRLYNERELFLINLRALETKIFGKPLDRKEWKKSELKRGKVKVVWKAPQETRGGINDK